jgi:hypothetical protein
MTDTPTTQQLLRESIIFWIIVLFLFAGRL